MFNDADHYIKVATNKKPEFDYVEVKSMTLTSATIKARATDGDGENLTYILYMGTSEDNLVEKAKKENVEQGTEEELLGEGIDTANIVYYRVEVIDAYATIQSQVSTLQNKKPVIEKAEIKDITRTTAKAIIQGIDEDGDKLTYKIYYGTDKDALETTGKVVEKKDITSGTEETLDIKDLRPGTKYYYKIAITDGMQTVHKEGEFTSGANNAPIITPTVIGDITVNSSDPTKSTSWIQISAKAEDTDNDKLDIKIYLGTSKADSLGQVELIGSQIGASTRSNINK